MDLCSGLLYMIYGFVCIVRGQHSIMHNGQHRAVGDLPLFGGTEPVVRQQSRPVFLLLLGFLGEQH